MLHVFLQNERLKVQAAFPEVAALRTQIQYKAKVGPQIGYDTYTADWRKGDRYDLVLSVTMAAGTAKQWLAV